MVYIILMLHCWYDNFSYVEVFECKRALFSWLSFFMMYNFLCLDTLTMPSEMNIEIINKIFE